MKKLIAIRMRYKRRGLFTFAVIFLVSLFTYAATVFISEKHVGAAVGCFAIVFLTLLGYGFLISYGLYVGKTRLIAIEQSAVTILRIDDISRIHVRFKENSISCHIKMKNQKEYTIVWDGIYLGHGGLIFRGSIPLKLTRSFVDNSIKKLEACNLIEIADQYR